jgi:hypothetical protein
MTDLRAGLYRHIKGGYYQVLGLATHHETREEMVVYVALDTTRSGPRMFVRPAHGPDGFFTKVRWERAGNTTPDPTGEERFTYVGHQIGAGCTVKFHGQPWEVTTENLTYEEIVTHAGYKPDRILSVVYSWRGPGDVERSGTLIRGGSVRVAEGMHLSVADTSNA